MSGYLVECSTFEDEKFRLLSDGARVLWLCLLCGPVRQRLPGLLRTTPQQIADVLERDIADVERWLGELSLPRMVEYDNEFRVLRVPNAPKYHRCPNPRVLWSWWTQWLEVPDSSLKWSHLETLRLSIHDTPSVIRAWNLCFGMLAEQLLAGATRAEMRLWARRVKSAVVIQRKDHAAVWQTVSDTVTLGSGSGSGSGSGGGIGIERYSIPLLTVSDTVQQDAARIVSPPPQKEIWDSDHQANEKVPDESSERRIRKSGKSAEKTAPGGEDPAAKRDSGGRGPQEVAAATASAVAGVKLPPGFD